MAQSPHDSRSPSRWTRLWARTRRRKKKSASGQHDGGHRFLRIAGLSLAAIALGGLGYYSFKASRYDLELLKEVPQRTLVYDRHGDLLGHVSGHGENRLVVPVAEISPHFIKALLAREDQNFYQHGGVDYKGVIRAMITNVKSGDAEQGASTLTMQLARNTFGMKEKSIARKLLEVAVAQRIERAFSKDEILGFYVNRVYFGSGLYGIERAAQGFFMKPASDLTLGESAMLAGVIRGPSLLNPFRSLEDAKATRDEVLSRLLAEGHITTAEAEAAKAEQVRLRPPNQRIASGSYILQTIYDLLDGYLSEEQIQKGGLKIHTSVDAKLQASAEKALDAHLTKIESQSGFSHPTRAAHKEGASTKYLQGAVVTIDNQTGGIMAMVGGRDFGESPFNRAYLAKRQVGSTFKPFVYAVAFDRGHLPAGAYVSDDAIRVPVEGGSPWSPSNSDGTFTGLQPAAVGLIKSRNTMSVRVGLIGGLGNVRGLAEALKLGTIPNSPVSFLGAFEASPMSLTSAYSTFACGGVNRSPFLISFVENAEGERVWEQPVFDTQILPPGVAWVTADILSLALDEGTGSSARSSGYKAPAAGKTGTTNDYHDAWFVGFTDKVTTGVWVGLDTPATIMQRGYGSTLALPVWTEVMKTAETAGYAAARVPPPPGTTHQTLCRECGRLSSGRTNYAFQMSVPPDLMPRGSCQGHGGGLFAGRGSGPIPFPIPGFEETIRATPVAEEGGFGKAIRGFGKFLFGSKGQ